MKDFKSSPYKCIFVKTFLSITFIMIKLYLQIIVFVALGNIAFSCNANSKPVVGDSIIDPVETKVWCGCEFRTVSCNIVVYNSEIKNELKCLISGIITFDNIPVDTINPFPIKDFEASWLRLIDVETNETVFNKSIKESIKDEEDYRLFLFYRDKLQPVIMNLKCWIEHYNHSFPPPHRLHFSIPFKVIPAEEEDLLSVSDVDVRFETTITK